MSLKKHIWVLIGLMSLLQGCDSYGYKVLDSKVLSTYYSPDKKHATVVFVRPSILGFGVNAYLFDVKPDENIFIGIVPAQKKIAFRAKPGKHLFMIVGENAAFMNAVLLAGKTYYTKVDTDIGWLKARFSFQPVSRQEFKSAELEDLLSSTQLVESTTTAFRWAKKNAPSIFDKRESYFMSWSALEDNEKQTLRKDDGV